MNQQAKEVIARIETAFRSMKPWPLTLRQANAAEDASAEPFEEQRRNPTNPHWADLDDIDIESCGKAFYGADIESWLSFVPAWMRWSLRNYDKSDSFVVDQVVYTLDPNHH
ncbi:MAG: DUF6714 family protein [Planctomycetota bacterium]